MKDTINPQTQLVEAADEWLVKHLNSWLIGEFTDDVISDNNIVERMLTVYNEDPEYWERQSWWQVFDAAGISRVL